MEKEIKITPPEGYEIDKENSTFEHIKFKPVNVTTYNDVLKSLENDAYYDIRFKAYNNKQAAKLMAINKLLNVAKYLNCDWEPNWDDSSNKWFIHIKNGKINICHTVSVCSDIVYFKFGSLAQQAIDILGEDTIRLALTTKWL